MSVLQTIDLKKYYGTEPNITRALDGVNFSVNDGEFVAVVGTSGSGKSTLLHMMGGLDTPTSGNVIVRDKELSKMNDEQLTIFRRRNIGFIFQNYNLVPILNVYENIVLPVELDGDTVDQKFLDEIVHLLGLEDKLKNMPNNLSGGQQQRVAIARALITKPAIVLADEPTGNLDSKTSAEVLGLIKRTSAEFRQTVVMITHNDDIARLADRIVRMNSKYFVYASKSFDFALMAGVIAIVLIGGYIVIQSIFRISINDKIKSYGQLRTIGATPKQIKRIVKREGRKLGSIGILIGTVLGVCGGFLLFPKGFNAVSYVATIILTLISSWIMVSVSIRKPIKIAAGISPIEAVRFTPAQKDIRSRKKNIKLNPVSMGIANFKRDRKKTVAIVASLSLGGIILLVVSSIVLLRSPEALARRFFPDGDYKIYLDSEMTEEKVMAAGNPLNEELKQEILSIDGVTDIIPSRQSLYATLKTDIYQSGGMCDMLTDQNYATVEAALTAGTMPKDSRSIVIDYNVLKQNEDMGVGSTVDFYFGEGQPPVSVTVSGLFDSNKTPSGHGKLALDGVLFFAPEALFHELHPEIASFDYSWSIVNDPKKTDYVGAELKNIVASHSNIALDEINTVIEYEEMTNSFAFGSMEILSWLVFLFGVINLINTTLSNQIARKQENSILRSIGLTQKQLCEMNICEGLCYALFATLATLIVGLPASIFACRKMSIGAFAGNVVPYKFPVLEMGLFILVLFGMELILSVWTIRRQKKQSLIEQMRAME
ncbi:MAG: ATP-binding cassette domain-containing protein [Faecalibacterium sp.]